MRVQRNSTWIFTTTFQGQKRLFDGVMDACPFMSRAIELTLEHGEDLVLAFAVRARQIAQQEQLDGQPLDAYVGFVRDCQCNLRKILQCIEAGEMLVLFSHFAASSIHSSEGMQFPKLKKGDTIMNAFNVASGSMTWWTLGPQTDSQILHVGLTQLGLPNYAPKSRTWLMSLKAALGEKFAKPEELLRPLRHKHRNGYTVVIEDKGEHDNTSSRWVNVGVDKEGQVSVTAGHADCGEVQRLTNHYRRVLPAASVSDMLTDIIHGQLGGISLKANGGLYFIPEEHLDQWKNVIMVVEAAALEPTSNDLSVIPLEMNEMTLRDIKRSITREIETAAERLRKDITDNELGDEGLLNRAVLARELRDRIRQYENILDEALVVCHQNLDTAVQAFSVASAVQEDDEVYEGVFA